MKKKYAVKDLVTGSYYYGAYGWNSRQVFGIPDTFDSLEDAEAFIESEEGGYYTIETIYIP